MKSYLSRHGFLAGILLVYIAVCATLIPIAIDDIRMADVYSVDESGAAVEIRHYYTTGSVTRASFKYGSLYYYIPLAAISIYGLAGTVTDQIILIVLRSFGALAGVGCLVVVFRLASRLHDRRAGAIACTIVGLAPVFLRWSVESHPDLPQLLVVSLFLMALTDLSSSRSLKQACLAALLAALAFNTKYVGIFLMPSLAFAILFFGDGNTASVGVSRLKERDRWFCLVSAILVFTISAAATNPVAVLKFDAFQQSLIAERRIMSFGHSFRASGGAIAWLRQTGGTIGWPHILVLLAAVGWAGTERRTPRSEILILWVWCATYLIYLISFSQLIRPRHVLPIVPVFAVTCGWAYAYLWDRFTGIRGIPLARYALIIPAALGFSMSAAGSIDGASIRLNREAGQDEIQAGRWLAGHYDGKQSVMYDSYAYVPRKFQNTARTFGMTYLTIEHFRPDLLVVRDAIASDFADTLKAADSRIGRIAFLDSHFFYSYLREGRLSSYRLVKSWQTLAIYERTERLAPRQLAWLELMKMFGRQRILGVSQARSKMAEIHLVAGRHTEAREQRELAHKARSPIADRFNSAKGMLAEGRPDEARKVFGEMLALVIAQPDSTRAAVHQGISRAYFEAGYYDQSVREARRAILLHGSLKEAHFELGVFLLAAGETRAADSVFVSATGRFGKSSQARRLLEQIAQNGIVPEAARRAVQTHF